MSVGSYLIPNRVLKECYVELAPICGAIFRKSLALGQLPSDWLKVNVIGIYKKGQKCEPSNYRPVSLTSVTCKLMEHIIYSQVMKYYTKHNFINSVQHGFLKGLSCDTQLVTTVEELQRGLDKKASRVWRHCAWFSKKPSTRFPTATFSGSYTLVEWGVSFTSGWLHT